jgi:hypothetical protein
VTVARAHEQADGTFMRHKRVSTIAHSCENAPACDRTRALTHACIHARTSQTMHMHTQLPDHRDRRECRHAFSHTRAPPTYLEEDNMVELGKGCSSIGGVPFFRAKFGELFPKNIHVVAMEPEVIDTWKMKYFSNDDMPRTTDHWFLSSSENTAFFMQSKARDTSVRELVLWK